MLRRVAAILHAELEAIIAGWVVALRRTPVTAVHNEMVAADIVDGMKAILVHLTTTVRHGVAPGAESALAAEAAELISRRHCQAEPARGEGPPLVRPDALPAPILVLPGAEPQTAADLDGARPPPRHRLLYQVAGHAAQPVGPGEQVGAALRQALVLAEDKGRLRQTQGYQINEVVQEYVCLRQELWKTLAGQMRRTDQPAVQLGIYLNSLLDDLLVATVQAYQAAAVADLEKRAIHDPLTGLYNHDYCRARLHEEVRRAHRNAEPITLIMFDLDHLKRVNDTYGHQAGDRVLIHVAAAMRQVARESDVLCRYAGDEFLVVLPGSDRAQGLLVAERLRNVVRGPVLVGPALARVPDTAAESQPAEVFVTISAGLATYPDDARLVESLIAQADAALYRAKAAGRDRVA